MSSKEDALLRECQDLRPDESAGTGGERPDELSHTSGAHLHC